MSKNTVVVVASAAVKRAYKAAKAAEAKGYGAFVSFIGETAKASFDKPITVATFAAFVGDDLSVGKEVSASDKAERNRIRARIRYGLESVQMLEENTRKPAAAGSKAKGKGKAKGAGELAAEAAANAAETAQTNPKDRFSAVCSILGAMSRDELLRVANHVATLVAAKAQEGDTAKAPASKAPRKRTKAAKAA